MVTQRLPPGAVTTSSTSTRVAGGFTLTQLVTDFGRTSELVRSSRLTAQAASQHTEDVKLQILRDVDQAYFATEAAESVRGTAQAVLAFRKTSLRQLTALAQSQLRSTLDVQFAQVLVSEAQMAVVHADSAVQEARAQLAAAMGDDTVPDYILVEQPEPPLLEDDVQRLHPRGDQYTARPESPAAAGPGRAAVCEVGKQAELSGRKSAGYSRRSPGARPHARAKLRSRRHQHPRAGLQWWTLLRKGCRSQAARPGGQPRCEQI